MKEEKEEELHEQLIKLQATVISNNVIINTYVNRIEELDKENKDLKEKENASSRFAGSIHEISDLSEDEKEKLLPIVEKEVKKRYKPFFSWSLVHLYISATYKMIDIFY